jgi:hypothetical protein
MKPFPAIPVDAQQFEIGMCMAIGSPPAGIVRF